jgi:hypothetical protein
MKVVGFVQNTIKDLMDTNEIVGNVYISAKRNSEYPYCIINVNKVKDVSNIKDAMFICYTTLIIYSRDNDNMINISENIRNCLNNIIGTQNDEFMVKNVTFEQNNLKLFNEINLVWNIDMEFKILVKKL